MEGRSLINLDLWLFSLAMVRWSAVEPAGELGPAGAGAGTGG